MSDQTTERGVKQLVRSIITSSPFAITLGNIEREYKNTVGHAFLYQKLGYNSLEHFLRSMPDTVLVSGAGPNALLTLVVSEKSQHINELVAKQKVTSKNRENFPRRRTQWVYPLGYDHGTQIANRNETKTTPTSSQKMYYPVKKDTSSSQPVTTYSDKNQLDASRKCSAKLTNNNQISSSINSFNKNDASSNSFSQNFGSSPSNRFCKNDSSLSSHFPKNGSEMLAKQQNEFNDTNKANNSDVGHGFEDIPVDRTPPTSKWMNNHKQIVNDRNRNSTERIESRVPVNIRNNLRTLIRQCPEGIWCAEVPDRYRRKFGQQLDYQELGFKSLIHLCISLSSIFHYVRPGSEDYKLYDRSQPLPSCAEKSFTMASYATDGSRRQVDMDPGSALPNIDWIDVKRFLPDNIFVPGEEIPRTFIPHDVKENDNIDVVIGEIYDLSKFWVYLNDSRLDQLMDEIQDFYKEHAQEYLIPDQLIREGVYCVQVIFGEYHRALIVDRMPELEDTVRVIFIDYGTMTKVPTRGLCFLHIKFSTLEAQAVRCRLANVFPLEEGAPWSREASKAFRKLVVDRDLSAKISYINWDDQYLEVYLADVTDEDNIYYINDRLVEEGFAKQPNQERTQCAADPIYMPIVKYIHLFPTFLELEHGLAPSTAEMEVFHECNLPINFCYPQYFYVDYAREEEVIVAAEDFHERYCVKGKRRTPSSQYFDVVQIKTQEPEDLTIFGELCDEIVEFLDRPAKHQLYDDNEEDFVDADEDPVNAEDDRADSSLQTEWENIIEKEMETANVLKDDIIVTEDIIKDINEIHTEEPSDRCSVYEMNTELSVYTVQPPDQFSDYEINTQLLEQFQEADDNYDFNFPKDECQSPQSDALWMMRENAESEDKNYTVINNSEDVDILHHPLSAMTFEESVSTEEESGSSDPLNDLELPDVHLSSVDVSPLPEDPLALLSRLTIETEQKINEFLKTELGLDDAHNILANKQKCTNPFLEDIAMNDDQSVDVPPLNPTNPFLTYQPPQKNDDDSSQDSTATVYDSPIVVRTQHSWSNFSDMSADTVSQLGKSLCSGSSSSGSVQIIDDKRSCYTQTAEQKNMAVQAGQGGNPYEYFCPPTPYVYPSWSVGYTTNPYYSVRFANFQGYMYQSQFARPPPMSPGFGPPGLGPPPGFFPPNRYGPPVNFCHAPLDMNFMQPPRPANYRNGESVARQDLPAQTTQSYHPPQMVVPPASRSVAEPVNALSRTASMTSVCVSVVSDSKDFYDMYNERLKQSRGCQ